MSWDYYNNMYAGPSQQHYPNGTSEYSGGTFYKSF